jgi:hypothetical protein
MWCEVWRGQMTYSTTTPIPAWKFQGPVFCISHHNHTIICRYHSRVCEEMGEDSVTLGSFKVATYWLLIMLLILPLI